MISSGHQDSIYNKAFEKYVGFRIKIQTKETQVLVLPNAAFQYALLSLYIGQIT
jgi:hypothetical protein